jgi:hypothetical protein
MCPYIAPVLMGRNAEVNIGQNRRVMITNRFMDANIGNLWTVVPLLQWKRGEMEGQAMTFPGGLTLRDKVSSCISGRDGFIALMTEEVGEERKKRHD